MSRETVRQYQLEERTLIRRRVKSAQGRLHDILQIMANDDIAPKEHVARLSQELSEHYGTARFARCRRMGELIIEQLARLDLPHTGL